MVETLSKNITRQGLTATTLNYLRVSSTVSSIEPLDSEVGQGAGQSSAPPDPESLPLPSAHTLTGQTMSQPGTSLPDNMDFGSDSFQF